MEKKSKLNKLERLKESLKPKDYDITKADFNNLSEDDRFYLKNYGIYNIKLNPNFFMLRVRVDGKKIKGSHFKSLLLVAKEFDLKVLLTARGGIELHKIEPKDILKVYNLVKELKFNTHQTLTDNVRNIVIDPYDGISTDSKIDSYKIAQEIQKELLDNQKYFGMIPRKFNCAIIGTSKPLINYWGNDLLFALAKDNSVYGFNVYVGGKNSESAKSLNLFIKPTYVKELFFAILDIFIEYGLRGSRAKTRLFYLIEKIGINSFRDLVLKRVNFKIENEQELLMSSSNYKDAYTNKIECYYGEVNINRALDILDDSIYLRVGVDQNLHIISNNLSKNNKALVVGCAGARYCPLSLWDIKNDIKELNLDIFLDEGVDIGFSGCLKGCGRHHHNHIGLVGLRTNMFGPTQKALRVFIGATQSPKPTPARLLYYAVPINRVELLFKDIINEYKLKDYKDFNEFNNHLLQFEIETLQLWFILRGLIKLDNNLVELFHSDNSNDRLIEALKKLDIYPKDKELYEAINILSHKLWDN